MITDADQDLDANTRLFDRIEAYPWDSDVEFQGGLAAILGPIANSSPEQTQDLTLRARLFYYARKNEIPPINFDSYKAYQASKVAPAAAAAPLPPYPTPFAEIVALITAGKPIPGIKDIPDTVVPEQATLSTASKRRKPWEKETDLLVEQRTFGDRRDEMIVQEASAEKVGQS